MRAGQRPQKNSRLPGGGGYKENNMAEIAQLHPVPQVDLGFIQEGFHTFTAAQANIVLRECPFDGQRKISKDHVAVLADIMKRNVWEEKDKLDFAMLNGRPILINGYHRMHAQIASGKPIRWTVIMHPCVSMNDVRALYFRFDTNTRIRGYHSLLDAMNFAEQAGLSKTMATAVYRAMPLIANKFSDATKDRDNITAKVIDKRMELARRYRDAAQRYEAAITGCLPGFKNKFYSAGVCAVALVTFRDQAIRAAEFWNGAAINDGLRRGDPRHTMNMYLHGKMVHGGGGRMTRNAFAPAACWNAFFEDRDLLIVKIYEGRKITVAGTEFEE